MNARNLLYLVLFIFLIGCKQNQSNERKIYPEYTLSNLSGEEIHITKIKNRLQIPKQTKPVLFFFIQPSCTQCFKGIEHIERIYQEYKDKITFIAILTDLQSHRENFKSEVQAIKQNYHLSFDFYYCKDGDFFENFQRQTDSNFIALYDTKLRLVGEYEGIVPEEMIELNINQILNTDGEK